MPVRVREGEDWEDARVDLFQLQVLLLVSLCQAMIPYVVLCYVMLCLCYARPLCAILGHAMPCYASKYTYDLLRYDMLSYVT